MDKVEIKVGQRWESKDHRERGLVAEVVAVEDKVHIRRCSRITKIRPDVLRSRYRYVGRWVVGPADLTAMSAEELGRRIDRLVGQRAAEDAADELDELVTRARRLSKLERGEREAASGCSRDC